MDNVSQNTPAELWGLDNGNPVVIETGTLSEINKAARLGDGRIAERVRRGEITGLVLMSSDPGDTNAKTITEAAKLGIPAAGTGGSSEEVATVARRMEEIGVDMIGLMTGMSYGGAAAGSIPNEIKDRLASLTSSVSVPTLAEGGINADNFHAFRGTGVNIIVVGTSFDDVARSAVADMAKKFIHVS